MDGADSDPRFFNQRFGNRRTRTKNNKLAGRYKIKQSINPSHNEPKTRVPYKSCHGKQGCH
jgi:hypothetical protein